MRVVYEFDWDAEAEVQSHLATSNERTQRLTAANEAIQLGYGGVSLVHRASGLSRKALTKGM